MGDSRLQYDLAIAWTWKYDSEFIRLVQQLAQSCSLRVLLVDQQSVGEVLEQVRRRVLFFRVFLDRASDEDEAFLPLARLVQRRFRDGAPPDVIRPVNPQDMMVHAADKATMHLEFLSSGINVPYTIIISPWSHRRELELSISELAKLGRPFIIKPANTTGGGIGVVTGAESLKDVFEARQHHRNDKYLLQETIKPTSLGIRRGWFRVFYAFGKILPCWWDDITHIYSPVSPHEESSFGLEELRHITEKIFLISRLDFFSTELVVTEDQRTVSVDYVNEMCDMRLQSVHEDGVPDSIVAEIAGALANFVKNHTTGQ